MRLLGRARARALHAAKVTGDENVPRGAVSWTAEVARACEEVRGARRGVCARAFGDLARCRVYPGTGMTSARGYMRVPAPLCLCALTP